MECRICRMGTIAGPASRGRHLLCPKCADALAYAAANSGETIDEAIKALGIERIPPPPARFEKVSYPWSGYSRSRYHGNCSPDV